MTQEKFDPYNNGHDGPVFATQGGGYATEDKAGQLVWLAEIPSFVDASIGDPIPEEWGITVISDTSEGDQLFAKEIASLE